MSEPSTSNRARIAFAVAARETSDYARGLVGDVGTPMLPGERIRSARRLRVLAMTALDRAVLIEAATGTSWDEIGVALGFPDNPGDAARARYADTFDAWASDTEPDGPDFQIIGEFGTGLRADSDPVGTAEALDAWHARHAEPWDERAGTPVSSSLRQ